MINLRLNFYRAIVPVAFLFTSLLSISAFGQNGWSTADLIELKRNHADLPQIEAHEADYFQIDFQALYHEILQSDGDYVLILPAPDGKETSFMLVKNTTMSNELQAKNPEISAYNIISTESRSTWGKLDVSPNGLHAMYKAPGAETVFIDPLWKEDSDSYILYTRSKYIANKTAECLVGGGDVDYSVGESVEGAPYNSCDLKTYRLAIAATGEYTQFQGGSVSAAMAAIVTTINRVNMVYERDFGVTLELIENTNLLIYTNPNTDPYTNGNPGAMITQNQSNINNVIGSANYDIGHVFGTNSGGLAGLGVVCSSQKARGVTGSGAPIGDAFDIDYVAHEMGHQFGADHTFNNSCDGNRNNATAVEPGSGSTIMAYAGICPPNVQNNSDDYFHGVSMKQIGVELESHSCGAVTSVVNFAPEIESVTTDLFLPISTPFALTGQASDPDANDVLTYCWEQRDNQISTQPPSAASLTGPNFRSFDPSLSPTRYFPRLQSLAASANQMWEKLPAVGRNMKFRLTVRDNAAGAGCTQYQDANVTFVSSAGPFTVLYPSGLGISWDAFTSKTVLWDVANTDVSPIDCQLVNIYLSVDGGLSYPVLLAENVPNNGSAVISVPNTATTTARVMVMNDGGTFFDISNSNFTINGVAEGFYLSSLNAVQNVCVGENVVFNISAESVGGFNAPISLSVENVPAEISATFGTDMLLPGETTTLTLSNTSGIESGVLDLLVNGVSGSFEASLPLHAGFNAVDATIPELISPENNAQFVSTDVEFVWSAASSPNAVFQLQLALDADFENLINDITNLEENTYSISGLDSETVYYWRVKKSSECGDSDYSDVFKFTTHSCFNFTSTDLPKTIPTSVAVIASNIEVASSGIITDVNVTNITGTHNRVSDLVFKLKSPQGTEVTLAQNICGSSENFNFGFDDAAGSSEIDCPPTSGEMYAPQQLLSAFDGQDSQGMWQLKVFDQVNGAGGELTAWSIELCFANGGSFLLTTNESIAELCQNDETSFGITSLPVFEFNEVITLTAANLPDGVSASFNPNQLETGESSTVVLTASQSVVPGIYEIAINGVSANVTYDLIMNLYINEEAPAPADLEFPENLNNSVPSAITFEWSESVSPSAIYTLDIALDAAFTEPIESFEDLISNSLYYEGLPPVETIYWRVTTDNGCGESTSDVFSFTTLACSLDEASDLPISISAVPASYTSQIDIPLTGTIQSVRVSGLTGTHFRVSDLSARLISPQGTVVELFANICDADQDFNLTFGDGGLAVIDCPPTTGLEYKPLESLSAFIGEEADGLWTLEMDDDVLSAGGVIESWSLEVCFDENIFIGVENAGKYDLSLFPNPASDQVKIRMDSNAEVNTLDLYDVSGRLLKSILINNKAFVTIDLSSYASGVYFIRANGSKGSAAYKLIKEN